MTIMRGISEVGNAEKVQIHFKFNDLKHGYAEIARVHKLDNCDIYIIVQEIEKLKAQRTENPIVRHRLRRIDGLKHQNKPESLRLEKKHKRKKAEKQTRENRKPINPAWAMAFESAKHL